jgi:hypothetical protein
MERGHGGRAWREGMEKGHGGRTWREHGEGMEREHRVGMERGRSFAAALRHSCTNPHSSACIDIDIQRRGLQPRGHSPSMHAPHTPRAPGGQGPLPVAGFASSAMSAASNVPSTIERSSLSARPNHSPSPIQSPSPFRHFPPGLPQAATQLIPPPPMVTLTSGVGISDTVANLGLSFSPQQPFGAATARGYVQPMGAPLYGLSPGVYPGTYSSTRHSPSTNSESSENERVPLTTH